MVNKSINLHIRHALLWLFDENNSVKGTDAAQKVNGVYGPDTIDKRTCQRWLAKFRTGEKDIDDLENEPRSRRPSAGEGYRRITRALGKSQRI